MGRKLVAGNWKMNGTVDDIGEIVAIDGALADHPTVDAAIFPPTTLLACAAGAVKALGLGGQDCHTHPSGAFTGSVSAGMLRSAGADYVILGHSERRVAGGETSATVRMKTETAIAAGLIAVICVGETSIERERGEAISVVQDLVAQSMPADATAASVIVAYEPLWSIGTGTTPCIDQIVEIHSAIRRRLSETTPDGERVRLLYGGSVSASNALAIMSATDVDGVLVGGASLRAASFVPIVAAAAAAGVQTSAVG